MLKSLNLFNSQNKHIFATICRYLVEILPEQVKILPEQVKILPKLDKDTFAKFQKFPPKLTTLPS